MPDPPDQPDLLAELASRLSASRSDGSLLAPVDPAGRARILLIARDVAHATERQNAPLAAYLIGRFVQESIRSGISEAAALDQAASEVRSLIGESPA
jgi:Cft2 family RNA processing exonuclease